MLTARIDDLYEDYDADAEGPDDRGREDEEDEIVEGTVLEEVMEEESSSESRFAIESHLILQHFNRFNFSFIFIEDPKNSKVKAF